MYKTICISTPAMKLQENAVEISTLSTIPEFLRNSVFLAKHKLWMDNVDGRKCAPMGSVIGYEKSDLTASGYSCWFIGRLGIDLVKNYDGSFSTKPHLINAMLIPDKDDAKPLWVASCNLTYNGDGTATLKSDEGSVSGRIGIDFILCHGRHGIDGNGKPKVSILATYDESYNDYFICDDSGNLTHKLSELYPV